MKILLLAVPAYAHMGEDAALHHTAPLHIIALLVLIPVLYIALTGK
jgi:hypothetical protein